MLRTSTAQEAFEIRGLMRREWEDALLPALERAFDEVDTGERSIHLSRIELTLKVASNQDLATALPELLYRQLGERLRTLLEHGDQAREGAGRVEISMEADEQFNALLHYLRTGSLLWSASAVSAEALVALRLACAREPRRLAAALRRDVPRGEMIPFLFRLLRLSEREEVTAFIHALLDEAGDAGPEMARRIVEEIASADGVASDHQRLRFTAAVLARSLGADLTTGDEARHHVALRHDATQRSSDGPLLARLLELLREGGDATVILFRLIELMIEGEMQGALERLLHDLPDSWSAPAARIVAALAESGSGSLGRHGRLRLAATLLAASLREGASRIDLDLAVRSLFRLLRRLPAEEMSWFIDALLADILQGWRFDVARIVAAVIDSSMGRDEGLRLLAAILIESLRNSGASAPDLSMLAREEVSEEERRIVDDIIASLPPAAAALFISDVKREGERRSRSEGSREIRITPLPSTSNGEAPKDRAERNDRPATLGEHPIFNEPANDFPIAIANAGLVLLHPFISPLFMATGIIAKGARSIPEHSLPRAAALLHYLATGREGPHEFELGLAKVLLGLKPEAPVFLSDGLLGAEDREEADALLGAALGYWSALKSTSMAGLRASFLERGGLLRREDEGWRLQVEPASFDLLLKGLPWGISIVGLAWMPKPIHVEWERM